MDHADTSAVSKGAWLALAAMLVLAGALTWRLVNSSSGALLSSAAPYSEGAPLTLEEMEQLAEEAGDDPQAWQRLGLANFNANMFSEAVDAYRKAVAIEPENAVLWSALGEAIVMASETDPMPEEAQNAFSRSVRLDANEPRARYYLAVVSDLAGEHEIAIAEWLALLADTPAGAPWESDLVRTITQVGLINEIEVQPRIEQTLATRNILPATANRGIPGPTQEQMAAAASLSSKEQQEMAEGMVARLVDRLERDPTDVQGWIMLIRSYRTLGRNGKARDAYAKALASNPQSITNLKAAAEALGL